MMELKEIINDLYELDYYEAKEEKGTMTKHITVKPRDNYFEIKETIYNRQKVIYANEFTIDSDLLNEINDIRG